MWDREEELWHQVQQLEKRVGDHHAFLEAWEERAEFLDRLEEVLGRVTEERAAAQD